MPFRFGHSFNLISSRAEQVGSQRRVSSDKQAVLCTVLRPAQRRGRSFSSRNQPQAPATMQKRRPKRLGGPGAV
ncbi:hypothetical protein CGRA01v4_08646 [Colletotrichum graminicola]|nr:hypothetical protein CGRA01v4_08646 [Colletotrichum graminicola]